MLTRYNNRYSCIATQPRVTTEHLYKWKNIFLFSFNWRIAGLQGSASFRYVAKRFHFMCVCVEILFQILFPYRLLQNTEYSSLCYIQSVLVVYFIHSSCICEPQTPDLSLSPLCSLVIMFVFLKRLIPGKIEGRRRRGQQREQGGWVASPTPWTWVWANSGRRWRTGKPGVLQSMGSQRVRHDWATEQQFLINLKFTFNQQGPTV